MDFILYQAYQRARWSIKNTMKILNKTFEMKKLLVLIPVVALFMMAYSKFAPARVSEDGIQFSETSWEETISKAKAQNLPIFLSVSTSWCGYCKKMKRNAFSDKSVGTYFNQKFINLSIDAEKGEGIAIAEKLGVQGYPSNFIFNTEGKVIEASSGYMNKKELLKFAESGLKKFSSN